MKINFIFFVFVGSLSQAQLCEFNSSKTQGIGQELAYFLDEPFRQYPLKSQADLDLDLVSLVDSNDSTCSGVMINPCMTLTARHCTDSKSNKDLTAGLRDFKGKTIGERIKIENTFATGKPSSKLFENDWAILNHNKPVSDSTNPPKVLVRIPDYNGPCITYSLTNIMACSDSQIDRMLAPPQSVATEDFKKYPTSIYGYPGSYLPAEDHPEGQRPRRPFIANKDRTPVRSTCELIKREAGQILHRCPTMSGSSGGPILIPDPTNPGGKLVLAVQGGIDSESNTASIVTMTKTELESLVKSARSCPVKSNCGIGFKPKVITGNQQESYLPCEGYQMSNGLQMTVWNSCNERNLYDLKTCQLTQRADCKSNTISPQQGPYLPSLLKTGVN